MTDYQFRATEMFVPGTQKIELTAEPSVRRTLVFYTLYAIVLTPVFFATKSPWWEVADLLCALIFIMPFGIRLSGGATKAAWLWYAVFAVCAFLASAPTFAGQSPLWLLAAIPAVPAFLAFHRNAPHVLRRFGYFERSPWHRELAIIVILSVVLNYLCLSAVDATGIFRKIPHTPYRIVAMAIMCLVLYGPSLGIFFGIVTHRLLEYKFPLIVPIAIVGIFVFLYFLPGTLPRVGFATGIPAASIMAITLSSCLGLAYYFCQNTRVLLIFYVIYYLLYKIAGL